SVVLSALQLLVFVFFFQAEDGIRVATVTGVQTCALPISVRNGGCQCAGRISNLRFAPRDAHASFSLITREMALESLPQLSASFSSCRRPAVSANSISRAAHTRKFSTRL